MTKYPNLTRFKIEIPVVWTLSKAEAELLFKSERISRPFIKYHDMTGLWPILIVR